ncbi:hypothetical protein BSKO_06543 [Bryopsis sp. KO-2023]|nr:hypothetical protein BSKO_06543 [Bryopsis sp. KO-2023]
MPTRQTKVLVCNDDGISAPGIAALANALVQDGKFEVRVVAPSTEKSACSHSVSLHQPISVQFAKDGREFNLPVPIPAWSVGGTPVDATGLALSGDLFRVCNAEDATTENQSSWRPDVVVSGINRGANYGRLAYYSGTVGAAREATFFGVKAMAVSLDSFRAKTMDDFAETARLAVPIVDWLASDNRWPVNVVLNMNIPALDKSFCSKSPSNQQTPTPTTLAISRMGKSTVQSGYTLLESEGEMTGSENGIKENVDGIANLRFKMRGWKELDPDGCATTDDMIGVKKGFTVLAAIPPAYALDQMAAAEKCLSDWRGKLKHPVIDWFEGE